MTESFFVRVTRPRVTSCLTKGEAAVNLGGIDFSLCRTASPELAEGLGAVDVTSCSAGHAGRNAYATNNENYGPGGVYSSTVFK